MSGATPRLRMFAGPNGSGKSTLKAYLPASLLGVYLNADDIEQEIRREGFLDFAKHGVSVPAAELAACFHASPFLRDAGLGPEVMKLRFAEGRVDFGGVAANSYFASVGVDLLRRKLLEEKGSFTFETVMSHRSKVDFLDLARRAGYRTYLYFVATDDPAINVSRVRNRVGLGGHPVPEDKIVERYHRSLELLMDAIGFTSRAYVFDNSGDSSSGRQTWLAEITDGRKLELKTDQIPAWFARAVLDHFV